MREIGAMWQIGVLAAERRFFLIKRSPFSAVSHYVESEKFSGRLRPNGWFCIGVAKFATLYLVGICRISRHHKTRVLPK